MPPRAGALHGVRVLDLADPSGVYCGKLLADMGAEVLLIEPPGGTFMRDIGPFYGGAPNRDRSLFFWHYNTSKRSVTLDLETPRDQGRFRELLAAADVVVETFPPGHLDRLGLGYSALAAHNPRVTLVSITPFGQTGPYRHYRASDLIAQAVGGMVYVNGSPDKAPLQGFGVQAYHSASTHAAIGTLLALLAREVSGRGQWVDVSIQESVVATVEHASSFFHQDGRIAERQGSLHWTRCFRVGRCRDGFVVHCILGDWTSLIEWVRADGKAQDLTDPAWEDFTYRRTHCEHLFDVLDQWASDYTVAALVAGAQLRRLPYAAVCDVDSLPRQPQLRARGFFVPVHHAELRETLTYPGAPYVFSATPWRIGCRPPLVGEHNGEVAAAVSRPTAPPERQRTGGPSQQLAAPRKFLPLEGIRIIDFTWVVAGPVATRILADHGAEVIKVERRDALDLGSRRGGFTGNLNRGKQSIVINMNAARGIELARQLIARADVVIDNFSARVMRNWGFDYDTLRRLKADIIAVHMSGFGHTGPQQDYVSYGPTLQALSGYTMLMRHAGGDPVGWGFSYSDMAAGSSGALAVLIALWHRRRTGAGQQIDLSQFENVCALLGPALLQRLTGQGTPAPIDNGSQEMPSDLHGVYRCADVPGQGPARDRWCAIALFGEADWQEFCRVLGGPPWTQDPQFATYAARIANRTALEARVQAWTREQCADDVMTRLQDAGVAAAVVATAEVLCRRDPQLQARCYWVRVSAPEGDTVVLDGVPFRLSHTPGGVRAPGPLLGEHTDAVLQRVLGLNTRALAELRAAQIIA